MFHLLSRFFPYHRIKYSSKAIQILTLSDTLFISGMSLVDVIFSIFVITKIPGATVTHVGISHAIFMVGVVISEPLLSKFYDKSQNPNSSFYGFIFGNLLKSVFRFLFVFLSSIPMLYLVYLLLGIVHSIEYPAFAKLFTRNIDKGFESSDWGLKDLYMSVGRMLAFLGSGFIALYYGYDALFVLSAALMLVAGVLIPLTYRKEFLI